MKKKETKKSENQASVNQSEEQKLEHLKRPEPPRFAVQFDIAYGNTYIKKDGKSQTFPDMNLTVRQLLKNHTRGVSNDAHIKDPLYFDVQIPKITDITDVHEYKAYLKDMLDKTEAFLHDEKVKQQLAEQEEKEKGVKAPEEENE